MLEPGRAMVARNLGHVSALQIPKSQLADSYTCTGLDVPEPRLGHTSTKQNWEDLYVLGRTLTPRQLC